MPCRFNSKGALARFGLVGPGERASLSGRAGERASGRAGGPRRARGSPSTPASLTAASDCGSGTVANLKRNFRILATMLHWHERRLGAPGARAPAWSGPPTPPALALARTDVRVRTHRQQSSTY